MGLMPSRLTKRAVTPASVARSSFYFDMKRSSFDPEGAPLEYGHLFKN